MDTIIQRVHTWLTKTKYWIQYQDLSTKRIYYRMPKLIIDGSEIQLKNQLTYSGVELDRQL